MLVLGKLVKFVTANVSFWKIGKICYCKYQFWGHLEKFVTANVSFGKIWENLVLIFFTENYQILIIKVSTAV